MLKVFRENLKRLHWVLWLVVGVMVLFVFTEWGGGGQLTGTGRTDAAASIGKARITVAQFQREVDQTESRLRQMWGEEYSPELVRQMGVPLQVLERLINQQVLLDEAHRSGLRVTDEELRKAIVEIPAFRDADGRWAGEENYRDILRASGYTVADFQEAMRRDMLLDKFETTLRQGLYVPAADVERAYREQTERAEIRYVRLAAAALADGVEIEEEEVRGHFEQEAEAFRLPERRVADYLKIERNAVAASVEIPEPELRAWYQENLEGFSRPEQVHARHILLRTAERTAEAAGQELAAIRDRIEGGEDFAAVAEEVSEDPGSAQQGGDLGFFSRDEMVAPFSEAAFGAEPGSLVGPIESSFGVHLIEVLDRRAGGADRFEDVRDQIELRLRNERAQSLGESRASSLARQLAGGDASPAQLEREAAEDPAVVYATTPAFGREEAVPGIGRANAFTERAFELEIGAVSEAVRVSDGWAILVLREIEPARVPELEEVRGAVEERLRRDRGARLAESRLQELRDTLAGGVDLADAAEEAELEIGESGEFGAGDSAGRLGRAPEVVRLAMTLAEGDIGGPVRTDDGAVLFEVTSRTSFDAAAYAEQREGMRERLAEERLQRLLSSRVQAQRDRVGVQYNEELLERFRPETVGG